MFDSNACSDPKGWIEELVSGMGLLWRLFLLLLALSYFTLVLAFCRAIAQPEDTHGQVS